ncbi:MAG: hypothetical protein ACI31M_04780 [Bacilli bacterium]
MKKVDLKIDKFVDLLNRCAIYGEYGYYISPLVMTTIISEELNLSMSIKEVINYIKNARVQITDEEIKKYLKLRFEQDDSELKIRQENRKKLGKNPTEWTKEDIENASQQFVDDLVSAKYKYDPYTLEYFKKYIDILKEKSLSLCEIVNKIQNIALGKINDENEIKQIIDSLSEYDIKILENGNIYYQDVIRLLTPLIENVLALKEKVERANNLETYLNFSVSKHSLYRDGFTEDDIYPKRALQVKNYGFDTGYIRLSYSQKEQIQKDHLENFSAWLDLVYKTTLEEKIEYKEQSKRLIKD